MNNLQQAMQTERRLNAIFNSVIIVLIFATIFLVVEQCEKTPVEAMEIDEIRWTFETKTWLARAMVAEAGWTAARDHVAIAYVLQRQWISKKQTAPDLQFISIIRGYCAGLEPGRRELTDRQRWLRSLMPNMTKPDGWPSDKASWSKHKRLWATVLQRADKWYLGKLSDPCRGLAWHWGSPTDIPKGKMYRLDCGETLNLFYGVEGL